MGTPDNLKGKPLGMDRPPVRKGFHGVEGWLDQHARRFGDPNRDQEYRDPYARPLSVVFSASQPNKDDIMS